MFLPEIVFENLPLMKTAAFFDSFLPGRQIAMSALFASPGPFTMQPIIAIFKFLKLGFLANFFVFFWINFSVSRLSF